MDESWRGGQFGKKMFESFANAVIEQMLPRIREQIAARFPGATLRALEVDGKRVHVLDAHVPIGPRLVIDATRATLITRAEDLVSGGFGALSLERMEGTITLGSIRARASFESDPPSADWVRGNLTLSDLVAGGETFGGRARVLVSQQAWSIEEGVIEREGARLTLALRGGSSGLASVRTSASAFPSAAIAEVLTALGASFVPSFARTIRGRVSGSVSVEPGRDRIEARADLRTDASYLAIEIDAAMRSLRKASVKGKVAWQDALPPELFAHVRGASPISVQLEGSSLADLSGSLRCPQVDLRWLRTPLAIEANVADGRAQLSVSGEGVSLGGEAKLATDGVLSGGGNGSIEPSALTPIGGVSFDGSRVSLGMLLTGTTRAPRVDLTGASDRLVFARGDAAIMLSRLRAHWAGPRIVVSARLGRGTIAFTREHGQDHLRVERADAAALAAFFAPPVMLPDGGAVLWAVLSRDGALWNGEAHLEGARSRVTAKPLRFDMRERALDGTALHAIVGARDLAAWLGPFGPEGGAISVALELERAPIARLLDVRARGIAEGALEVGLADRTFAVRDIHVPIVFDGALRVRDARALLFGGSVKVSGKLDPKGASLEELAIENVGAGLARFLIGGPPGDLLAGLRLDGWLRSDAGALAGPLSIRTDRSSLSIRAKLAERGSLHGTTLDGAIATADVAPFFGTILDDARYELAGRFEGTLSDPIAKLDLRTPRQLIRAAGVALELEDARASLYLSRARLAWSELEARIGGGELRSSGALLRTSRGSLLGARASVEGVALDRISLDRGNVGAHLGGTVHASIDVWRGASAPAARATVRIDEPRYAFFERARAIVKRVSLDLPGIEGLEPFRARAHLRGGRWTLSDIRARVRELAVDGRVELDAAGAIDGRIALAPDAEWLRASPYLSPFADLLARSGLSLLLGGAARGLRVRPDLAALGDDILARSPIGRRLRELLQQLFPDAFERPSRPGEKNAHGAASLLSTDVLLDRLAKGGEDAGEVFEALLDRGLAPDEIAARIAGLTS